MILDHDWLMNHLIEYAKESRERSGYLKFKWWSADVDSIAEEHDIDCMELTYEVWLEWSRSQSHHDEDDLWDYIWTEDLEAILRKDPDYQP